MSPSLRFLGVALVAWAGVRAATLGVIPAGDLISVRRSEAKVLPPIVATEFPAIEPLAGAPPGYAAEDLIAAGYSPGEAATAPPPSSPPHYRTRIVVPYYVSAGASSSPDIPPRRTSLRGALPTPTNAVYQGDPSFYAPVPALDQWPLSRFAASGMPARSSTVIGAAAQSIPVAAAGPAKIDRIQMSAWAMLRGRQGQPVGTPSLAANGTLGASQAGSRITYNYHRQLGATLRTSSGIGKRGGEVAAGVRVQPVGGVPLWITAERRQRIGRYGDGRNAFALFFEGGVYQRPMPWRFSLDAYLQGGIVGFKRRDKFIDGGMTVTRPVYRNFSAGMGVWGAAQPGVYRVDAGPRVSMKVRENIRIHLDWRQRLAGKAEPGSGPAVTLAGDF